MAKLGASTTLHEGEVDATNWMSALRAARQAMSERPSLPPGASCSVDAGGVATILDPSSRRKFVLMPLPAAAGAPQVAEPAASQQPAPAPPVAAASAQQPSAPAPKRFQTVARIADQASTQPQPQPRPHAPSPAGPTESAAARHSERMHSTSRAQTPIAANEQAPARTGREAHSQPIATADRPKKRFETVAFIDGRAGHGPSVAVGATASTEPARPAAAAPQAKISASKPAPRAPAALEVLLERDEDPASSNPLCYRERAYLLPRGTSVPEAEAAMRWKLAELQQALEGVPRGKLVNLAVFDHRWTDAPERPPVVVLQWRDWRDEIIVDYPAAAVLSSAPPQGSPQEDRLADVFEALEGLWRLHTAAEGLDFVVRLLENMIPAEATSACLYDINTDELRFVAVSGIGSAGMQGQAVSRAAGLFGQALRLEHHGTSFDDVKAEPAFTPSVDSRDGLDPRNALLRPIVHEHQLLGMLQLINRVGSTAFTAQDISVINYVAERLAEFLSAARLRQRAHE